jgi:hypothetical protein
VNEGTWQRVQELYHSALKQPPEERATFLSGACQNDAQLLHEVESLLAHEGQADALLKRGRKLFRGCLDQ